MGLYIQEGSPSFNHLLFALILLNAGENKGETRKGIRFWTERLIISSAEELSFRGTRFWWQDTYTAEEC